MRYLFAAFLIVGIFFVPWIAITYPEASDQLAKNLNQTLHKVTDQVAAIFLSREPVTVEAMKASYDSLGKAADAPKVRILIVPGHEPDYGGAEYGSLKERHLNVELASNLMNLLRSDGHYEVFTTRYENSWTPEFISYFKRDWDNIKAWQAAHKAETQGLIRVGNFDPISPGVHHNEAPSNIANRLYGINKWANENNMDIVIHVHFNDYPRTDPKSPGKYNGFSIYVPERQYSNSSSTKAIADNVFKRLSKYNPVSNLPAESVGILEDQDLIAVGSFNSLDAASMLIEYSYIYEPQLLDPNVRHTFIKELAYETYLGLTDFFDPKNASIISHNYDTLTLPHRFSDTVHSSEVFALQSALIDHGDYPPIGSSLSDCPRTGKFGPCTKSALSGFQTRKSISDEKGMVGPKTIQELNKIYSERTLQ